MRRRCRGRCRKRCRRWRAGQAVERRARDRRQGAGQLKHIQHNQRKSMKRVSLTQYLVEEQRQHQSINPAELRLLIEVVARACKRISYSVGKGALGDSARQRRHREHPGRSAEEARRDLQRDPARSQRVGRPPGRDGVRRNGNHPPDPEPLSEGRVPAAVRSAGRLVEHRRQRVDRHDLLGAAMPRKACRTRPSRTSCRLAARRWPPVTPCTARRRCWCSPPATACTASRSTASRVRGC